MSFSFYLIEIKVVADLQLYGSLFQIHDAENLNVASPCLVLIWVVDLTHSVPINFQINFLTMDFPARRLKSTLTFDFFEKNVLDPIKSSKHDFNRDFACSTPHTTPSYKHGSHVCLHLKKT